jgi:CheY-like chemotaxis protein
MILVVDDELTIGLMARDILESTGYVVLSTSDPLEAIRLARLRPGAIDLLLVDVVMPVMDGPEQSDGATVRADGRPGRRQNAERRRCGFPHADLRLDGGGARAGFE